MNSIPATISRLLKSLFLSENNRFRIAGAILISTSLLCCSSPATAAGGRISDSTTALESMDSPYERAIPQWAERDIRELYEFLRANGFPLDLTHSELSVLSRMDIRNILHEMSEWMSMNHLRIPATRRRVLKRLCSEFAVSESKADASALSKGLQTYPETYGPEETGRIPGNAWNNYEKGDITLGVSGWFPSGPAIRKRTEMAPEGSTMGGTFQFFPTSAWSVRCSYHQWDKTANVNDYLMSQIFDNMNAIPTTAKVAYGRTMAQTLSKETAVDILYHIPSEKYKRFGAYAGIGLGKSNMEIKDSVVDFNGTTLSTLNLKKAVTGPRFSFGLEFHISRNATAWMDGVYRLASSTEWITPNQISLSNPLLFGNLASASMFQSLAADMENSSQEFFKLDGSIFQFGLSYRFNAR